MFHGIAVMRLKPPQSRTGRNGSGEGSLCFARGIDWPPNASEGGSHIGMISAMMRFNDPQNGNKGRRRNRRGGGNAGLNKDAPPRMFTFSVVETTTDTYEESAKDTPVLIDEANGRVIGMEILWIDVIVTPPKKADGTEVVIQLSTESQTAMAPASKNTFLYDCRDSKLTTSGYGVTSKYLRRDFQDARGNGYKFMGQHIYAAVNSTAMTPTLCSAIFKCWYRPCLVSIQEYLAYQAKET